MTNPTLYCHTCFHVWFLLLSILWYFNKISLFPQKNISPIFLVSRVNKIIKSMKFHFIFDHYIACDEHNTLMQQSLNVVNIIEDEITKLTCKLHKSIFVFYIIWLIHLEASERLAYFCSFFAVDSLRLLSLYPHQAGLQVW